MAEPRYAFWKPITPVEGHPIPASAEFRDIYRARWRNSRSVFRTSYVFSSHDSVYGWRVPVEVIPLDLAVDAIMRNATIDPSINQWAVAIHGGRLTAGTYDSLETQLIEHLREAATCPLT